MLTKTFSNKKNVNVTFDIFNIFDAVENFDILIASSFNENGGLSGFDEGKIAYSQKFIFFSDFIESAGIVTPTP
mgnify:CR=1 FL=1